MNIIKKITALFVAIIILFTMVPFNGLIVLALNDDTVCTIGSTEFTSLEAAVASIGAGETATIEMQKDVLTGGDGFAIFGGDTGVTKNITVDFKGHTFVAGAKLYGSTGTVSQNFHWEKGSTVILKNGTIKASSNASMFIQNYCNLTLDNVTLDGTALGANSYTLSSNCGTVKIINGSSIIANPNAYAFDMCWAPNKKYPEGTQMTVDTTGTIKGIIQLDVWGTFSNENGIKSTLTINNMNHEGTFDVDTRLKDQLTVKGGTYTDSNVEKYIDSSKDVYNLAKAGKYLVADKALFDDMYMEVEASKDLSYPTQVSEVATETEGTLAVTAKENNVYTIKAPDAIGTQVLNISIGEDTFTKNIIVYNSNDSQNEGTENVVSDLIAEDGIIPDTVTTTPGTQAAVTAAIANGSTITTEVSTSPKSDTLVPTAEKALVEAEITSNNIAYFDIDILVNEVKSNGDEETLGKVTELASEIPVTIDIPTEFPEVQAGYIRTYEAVRLHTESDSSIVATKLNPTVNPAQNTLTINTNKFSTYAIGYVDEYPNYSSNTPTTPSEPTTPTEEDANITKALGKYTINDVKVVPFILQSNEDRITSENLKASFKGDSIVAEENTTLGTGSKITINGEEYTIVVYGDVNGNGEITIADAVAIVRHLTNDSILEGAYFIASDLDHNKEVKINDAVSIVRLLTKDVTYEEITTAPTEE